MQYFVIIFTVLNLVTGNENILWDYEKFINTIEHLPDSISPRCKSEIGELLKNNRDALWNFFDSTSKFPWSGLTTSSKFDYGNYDQCINIKHVYSEGIILGKHCSKGIQHRFDNESVYYLSVCIPSGCNASDYNTLLSIKEHPIQDDACITIEYVTHFTSAEVSLIVVLVILAIVILHSTIYDVYLYKSQKKSHHPIYVAFSVFTNGKKILQTSKGNKEQIQIFNGMKSISMMLIIAYHAMLLWNKALVINSSPVTNFFKQLGGLYIFNALLSVDTFFFISGFLQAYGYMKQKSKPVTQQIKGIPMSIVHRYIRLTPAMAMTYFVYITIFKHLTSGPMIIKVINSELEDCRTYWLPFFLYIQNYYNESKMCLGHTWYLSVDMQLFLLSPIILIPMAALLTKNSQNLKSVMIILACLSAFCVLMPVAAVLLLVHKDDEFDHATHLRITDYVMGIMMGIFIREAKDKPFLYGSAKWKLIVNVMVWIIVLILMTATSLIYDQISNNGYSLDIISITHSLCRPVWCLCLCWMVYSSYHGYGGIINWILTRPTLQITAKLSYCMYLIHWLVLIHHFIFNKTRLWFSDYVVFIEWCGDFVVTFILAFIWCLCFEYPIMSIEKIIFGRANTRKSTENQDKPFLSSFSKFLVLPVKTKEQQES